MKKVKCPECGHIQSKRQIKIDDSFKSEAIGYFINQLEEIGTKFSSYVHCEQCGTQFIEEDNEK